ncbi:CCAAT-binding factor [Striga hermonthica]|uniref:CCAAT-binding factor n=1 Tax=Striga hermonthica TaxID=68872 RepID=A0A9N7N8D5_STRHE|nr:CCAAT-binding factor [Striga hermonthica]
MASVLTKKTKKVQKRKRENHSLSDLKKLGEELLTSRAHVNNLPILLTFISPSSPPQHALESLLSLQSFFTPLVPQLPSSSSQAYSGSEPDPELIYRTWLRSKFDDFIGRLVDVVVSLQSDDALREVVLDTIMEFVKVGNAGKFHSSIYHKLLRAIVHSELSVDDILLDLLATKYFNYVDVRYFTYISLEKQARTLEVEGDRNVNLDAQSNTHSRPSLELSVRKIHNLLSHIPSLEVSEENLEMLNGSGIFFEKRNNKENVTLKEKQVKSQQPNDKVLSSRDVSKKMKLKLSKAWISFLRLPLPLDVYKEVLVKLHQAVIPYLSNPIMLCDFLTQSYDVGGVVSVMALSSLFILMTQHGLEYPNFYDKLYALLEPSIFMAKHRAKFFELLDSCLKSSLLPAYLTAAFCKKLSRLALSVPPSGALVIIALVHNLLQRHPSINCLVHRVRLMKEKSGIDHFKNEETNPKDTNAMRSSLWEIDTLRHHYSPPVSRFVLSMENDLAFRTKTAEVSVKDFSSGSYSTIFSDEIRRRVKQVPLAFYKATPTHLFSESDFPGWTFKNKDKGCGAVSAADNDNVDASAKRQRVAI